ncbi:MAG: hypothetical protein O3B17_03685 [Actinomycetota bacterium]|nr:hypothetical protein [Actinomycetota bacterium]
MTISKHLEWGRDILKPEDLVICQDDAAASRLLTLLVGESKHLPIIAIKSSKLARALGTNGAQLESKSMRALPFDLIKINFTNSSNEKVMVIAIGYALLRNSWWRGEITAVLNTSFIGDWDCAPRSHPNDGKFDVVSVGSQMRPMQRLIASRRLRLGTHLPHPQISTHQTTSLELSSSALPNLFVDGQRFAKVSQISFTLLPDAVTLCW